MSVFYALLDKIEEHSIKSFLASVPRHVRYSPHAAAEVRLKTDECERFMFRLSAQQQFRSAS